LAGFAEVTGGADGALTGLLFVAVSLNASRIAGHRGLRSSAAQTLVLFLTPLFMLLFVASGICLVCGANDGLYLLLPASLVAFASGVLNAWYFLLPPPDVTPKP
jgi:hypothetical protein